MKKMLLVVFAALFAGHTMAVELKINVESVPALVGPSGITDVVNCSGTSLSPDGINGTLVTADITGLNCVVVVTAEQSLNDYEYDTYDMSSQCNIFSNGATPPLTGFEIWGGSNLTSQENFSEDCLLTFNGASGPPPGPPPGDSDGGDGGGSAATPVPTLPGLILGLLTVLMSALGWRRLASVR